MARIPRRHFFALALRARRHDHIVGFMQTHGHRIIAWEVRERACAFALAGQGATYLLFQRQSDEWRDRGNGGGYWERQGLANPFQARATPASC
jgi:hypothetical protein